MIKLKFGKGNAKLSEEIATYSMPAGYTCPSANECLCKANRETGQLTDGPQAKFRCFSATSEARATNVRLARWHNFELIKDAKTTSAMAALLQASLPVKQKKVRIHVSGDFYNEVYFKAWMLVAKNNPHLIFYGYTKQLQYIVKYRSEMTSNFRLVASKGGKQDKLIAKYNLVSAEVVFSVEEAASKGLEIDHDDHLAIDASKSFALLLHGGQTKGTPASTAWAVIKRLVGGYGDNYKKNREDRAAVVAA